MTESCIIYHLWLFTPLALIYFAHLMTHSQIAIALSSVHGLPGWILRTGTHSGGMLYGVGLSLMEGSKHFEVWRAAAELACGYVPIVRADGHIHEWAEGDYMTEAFCDGDFEPLSSHPFHGIDPVQIEAWIEQMAENGPIPEPFAALLSQIPIDQRFGENSIAFSECNSEILQAPLIDTPALLGDTAARALLNLENPDSTDYAYVDGRWLTAVDLVENRPSWVPLALALATTRLPGSPEDYLTPLFSGLSELDLADLDAFRIMAPPTRFFGGSPSAAAFFDARVLNHATPSAHPGPAAPRI